MSKRTVATWNSGLQFDAIADPGGAVRMEGTDGQPGYRPMALLLASLAGCAGMDVISICRKKRVELDGYEVVVSGSQVDEPCRVFESVTVEHRFEGVRVDDIAVSRAIELSARRYCPVTAHLSMGNLAIRHRYRIDDDDGSRADDVLTTGPLGAGLERAR